MSKIFESMQCNEEEIIESCLASLRDISTQEYDSIQYYFDKICEVTSQASQNPSDKVGAQAFEFWTTLIDDETERVAKNAQCYNYVSSCSPSLITMILKGLTMINFDDDDDIEMGHSVSAGNTLQALALLIKSDVMQPVISFVAPNLDPQQPWQNKYAALIALGSICNGPDK
jgi:importin subunit beta-1